MLRKVSAIAPALFMLIGEQKEDDLCCSKLCLTKIELHLQLDCSLSFEAVKALAPAVSQREYERDYIAPARCANLADFLTPHSYSTLTREYARTQDWTESECFARPASPSHRRRQTKVDAWRKGPDGRPPPPLDQSRKGQESMSGDAALLDFPFILLPRPRSSESRNLSTYDRGFAPAGGSDSLPPGHCDLLTLSALSRTKDQYSENVDDCTCLLAGAHSGDHSFEKVSRHRKRPDQFENLVLRGEPGDVRATEPFCLTR